jgi:hypothetical protein
MGWKQRQPCTPFKTATSFPNTPQVCNDGALFQWLQFIDAIEGILGDVACHNQTSRIENRVRIDRFQAPGVSIERPRQLTLATSLRSRDLVFGGSVFQNRIDFPACQNHYAAEVEPEHEDDQRAERAIKQPKITDVTDV